MLGRDYHIDINLPHHDSVQINLDGMRSFLFKDYIGEDRDVVGETALGKGKLGGFSAGHNFIPIRSDDFYLGHMVAAAHPSIKNDESKHGGGERLEIDILKEAHHAKLVADLETNIIGEERID
jgi:hypothetical protein